MQKEYEDDKLQKYYAFIRFCLYCELFIKVTLNALEVLTALEKS